MWQQAGSHSLSSRWGRAAKSRRTPLAQVVYRQVEPPSHQHYRCSPVQRGIQNRIQAGYVIERKNVYQDVFTPRPINRRGLAHVGDEVCMRQHDPLRLAGCSAGGQRNFLRGNGLKESGEYPVKASGLYGRSGLPRGNFRVFLRNLCRRIRYLMHGPSLASRNAFSGPQRRRVPCGILTGGKG